MTAFTMAAGLPFALLTALLTLALCCKWASAAPTNNAREASGNISSDLVGWCERMLKGSLRDACEQELKRWCREMAQATTTGATPKFCHSILAGPPQTTTRSPTTLAVTATDLGKYGSQLAPLADYAKISQLKAAFAKLSSAEDTPKIGPSQLMSIAHTPSPEQRTELDINGPDRLFMGDMQLTPFQWVTLMKYANRNIQRPVANSKLRKTKRKAGEDPPFRPWDGSVIPFMFDSSLREGSRVAIVKAIRLWQENTCLKLEEHAHGQFNEGILFTENGQMCSSFVGKVGRVQNISISWPHCATVGLVAHQIGHALGLLHEQNRLDRQAHLAVNFKGLHSNFHDLVVRLQPDLLVDFALPYDLGSVMHIAPMRSSKGNSEAGVVTVDPNYQWTIGQRKKPSFLDYKLVNILYCADRCESTLPCQHDGYEDAHDCAKCRCPYGLGGTFCERAEVQDGDELCGDELTARLMDGLLKTPSDGSRRCSWLLRSGDPNGTVHLQFVDLNMSCGERTCSTSFVEIKSGPRFDSTGYRFCCNRLPPRNHFTSVGPEMLVIYESGGRPSSEFSLRYRSVPNQILPTTTVAATTTETDEADGCPCEPWGPWSDCTQECGGCGSQSRTRYCHDVKQPLCPGVQSRRCNFTPCEGSKMIVNNGEFHLLFNGCCMGMHLEADGLCKPSAAIASILGSLLSIA